MQITLNALKRGLLPVEAMAGSQETRKQMEQQGMSMTEMLIQGEDSGNYLYFAAALDKLRKFAGSDRVIPGTYFHGGIQPLVKKMEELDTLTAGERAGLPQGAENPFIFSQLREEMGSFASLVGNCIDMKSKDFRLGTEEVGLLRALDGMYRHFGLPEQKDWQTLRSAVPAMREPVPMDDGMLDDLTSHWQRKALTAQSEARKRDALAKSGTGSALLLMNSRKAALADEKMRAEGAEIPDSPQSRAYLLFYSLSYELVKYQKKYEDDMEKGSLEAMRSMLGEMMILDDMMAGPDSHPQGEEPRAEEVEKCLREHTWPTLVRHFGSFTPTSKISEEDSRLFRIMYELQNTLALPEKVDGADMRKVYNFTQDPDKPEEVWPDALKQAHTVWARRLRTRTLEIDKNARREEERRLAEEARQRQAAADQKQMKEMYKRVLATEKYREQVKEAEFRRKQEAERAAEEAERMAEEEEAARIAAEARRVEEEAKERERLLQEKKESEIVIPVSPQDQAAQDPEVRKLMQEAEEARKKSPPPEKEMAPQEPPVGRDKTWGQFALELREYLKENVYFTDALSPRKKDPGPMDIPHIGQIVQFLVAEGRYGNEPLKSQTIDERELVQESNQLMRDPGFIRLLKDWDFRDLVAGRRLKEAWERITAASVEECAKKGQMSPYSYTVEEKQVLEQRLLEEKKRPVKTVVDSVYLGLTDERYNADIRKRGFLFFKPSDTGLYQTAVAQLKKLFDTNPGEDYRRADLRETKLALRAYLDDRKGVRSHEYGRHRWEKLMCAYKALEEPDQFAQYCAELNAHRGLTDPLDPNYVHPSAFGPERVDLKNPQVPMNVAYRRLRQDYAKANAAEEKDALLNYYSRVAAMRTQAALKLKPDQEQNPDQPIRGDWGVLLDMQMLEQQAKDLANDHSFRSVFAGGDREALLSEAMRILAPTTDDWTVKVNERKEPEAKVEKQEKNRGLSKE